MPPRIAIPLPGIRSLPLRYCRMVVDPFENALTEEDDLRALYGAPMQRALKKDVPASTRCAAG